MPLTALIHHPACPARRDDSAVCRCLASPLDSVLITGHARQRATEMGVLLNDVLLAITDPEVRYEQRGRGPDLWMHQRGRIAVAVRRSSDQVVALSVLPRISEAYCR